MKHDVFGLSAVLLALCVGAAIAEEGKDESLLPGLSGEVQVTGQGISGLGQSAKLTEYRDLPQGGAVDWIGLNYENKEQTTWFDLKLKDTAQKDMNLDFKAGQYGKWKVNFEFDRTPHNFLYDVRSIYSGLGTDTLRIPDEIQTTLQNGNVALTNANALGILRRNVGNNEVDEISLQRDRFKLDVEWMACDPVTFGVNVSHEIRSGGRPHFVTFGLSNPIAAVEPIDYDTTDFAAWVAYDQDWLHLRIEYGLSDFENNEQTLSFDNPFRITDATANGGYSSTNITSAGTPIPGFPNPNAVAQPAGAAVGRSALYPDNWSQHVTFDAGVDIGWKTRADAGFTYAWRYQDEDFLPYGSNSAITTGAVAQNDYWLPAPLPTVPFDTTNPANLPERSLGGEIETQVYSLGLTNKAIQNLDVRVKYRAYNMDNNTDQTEFAGQALVDGVWEGSFIRNGVLEEEGEEHPAHDYFNQYGGIEFAYECGKHTQVTLGYQFENYDRDNLTAGDNQWDHTILAGVESRPINFVSAKALYTHTWRDVDYDFFAAWDTTAADVNPADGHTQPPNLPFMRRFDMSDRERDQLKVQVTLFPCDLITPTMGYALTYDDYAAHFGLTEEIRHAVNFGFQSTPFERLSLEGYANWEWWGTDQQDRQWSPFFNGGTPVASGYKGNPWNTDTTEASFGNWTAETASRLFTLNFNATYELFKDKLFWENSYTYAQSTEHINYDSPIGPTATDPNPYDLSLLDISRAEDYNRNSLKSQFRWKVRKNMTVVFGYLMETYNSNNYHYRNYEPITTNAAGTWVKYIGFGMDDDPDYVSHTGFVSLLWEF